MKKKIISLIVIVGLIILCILALLHNIYIAECSIFSDCRAELQDSTSYLYLFSPDTLWSDIKNGNAFTLLPEGSHYPDYGSELTWSNADVQKIIDTLNQDVLPQHSEELKIITMRSIYRCNQVDNGLFASWRAYQAINKDNNSKTVRSFNIDFADGYIDISDYTYSPAVNNDEYLNFQDELISSKDALQLAEEAYGKDYRNEVSDQCNIQVSIGGIVGNSDEWNISYYKPNSAEVQRLEIIINAKNGEIVSVEDDN
ncbi:MAG: hypothetical protein JEZ00_18335 [Anaerolineaceae bacterium]|nr:hypothetical protein [Anaerolineaceae bacterium]